MEVEIPARKLISRAKSTCSEVYCIGGLRIGVFVNLSSFYRLPTYKQRRSGGQDPL